MKDDDEDDFRVIVDRISHTGKMCRKKATASWNILIDVLIGPINWPSIKVDFQLKSDSHSVLLVVNGPAKVHFLRFEDDFYVCLSVLGDGLTL